MAQLSVMCVQTLALLKIINFCGALRNVGTEKYEACVEMLTLTTGTKCLLVGLGETEASGDELCQTHREAVQHECIGRGSLVVCVVMSSLKSHLL